MTSANPISPKAIWAPIGALLGPLFLTIGQVLVDLVSSGSVEFPEPWGTIVVVAAAAIGALIAAYAKRDPLRLPTIDAEAVKELESNS